MSEIHSGHWLNNPQPGAACAVIAEVAQAHDGSLGMAHAFIDCAAEAGATAVKFQTHIALEESTPAEMWRTPFSKQDASRFDYWKRMEFNSNEWAGLKQHAEEKNLVFLSSPFSIAAVRLLRELNVAAWKVASGELTNLPMLVEIVKDKKPVMLSTGMSNWPEIDAATQLVKDAGVAFCVFQCTTTYPSPPTSIGLNVLGELRARYGCAVGLSDHSGTIFPALAAVASHRAEVVEVHLTMSRDMFGPDVIASVTPAELKQICDGVRFVEVMHRSSLDKSVVDAAAVPMRKLFFKSLVLLKDLPAGTVLTDDMIGLKKPGSGLPAADLSRVIGRRLSRDVKCDVPLQSGDIL